MKHRFSRALALALLLALAVSAMPALAAVRQASIVTETLYTDMHEYYMKVQNWTWTEEVISIKSSDPSVLDAGENKNDLCLIPKKTGKARITVKYRYEGKTYKMSGKYTVEKIPKAIESLIVNKQKVKLKGDEKYKYNIECRFDDKVSVKINLKPKKGWTISSIKAYTFDAWSETGKSSITVKNNKKFTVPGDKEAVVTYNLKKGKTVFSYTVMVERYGE